MVHESTRFSDWYKTVQDLPNWYKLVLASTRYLKFGTRRYKQVPDFPNWYKTVQDGKSQNQIFQYKQVQEYHILYIEVYTSMN